MPPTHVRRRQRPVALTEHRTPIGRLTLVASPDALVYCGFSAPEDLRTRLPAAGLDCGAPDADGPRPLLDEVRRQIDAYLDGRRRSFALPLDTCLATPFIREVVLGLDDRVPYGRTAAYGELARALGRPGAARAVGRALGANPLCVVLPCHRIVGSSGQVTGYAGGVEAKRLLLRLERAD